MKNISRLLAVCAALLCAPFAQAGSLGTERIISTDPSMGSQFPEVAYYNGIVHVVWEGYAAGVQADVFYSRSTDNGVTFSLPVNLSASATAGLGSFRPQVTAGPNGVFVGWNTEDQAAGNTGEVYVRRSTNGGASFVAAELIAGTVGDNRYARITQLFTDSGGRVHLAYYEDKETNGVAGMIRHRMNCTGSTWSTDVAVTSKTIDGDVDNEQARLGEAGGKLQIVFRSSRNGNPQGGWPPYSIQMQTGTVNAGTCTTAWSYPARRIGGGIPFTYASTYRPEVAGDAGGNVHVAYWDNTVGANVYYRRGNTSAGILGAPQKISSFTVDHLEPGGISSTASQLLGGFQVPPALASNGASAFIAYQKHQQVSQVTVENGPIYLRESTDNGTTWGIEQAISSFGTATTPRIAIGGTGNKNVAIVYSDMRSSTTARVVLRMYNVDGVSFEQNVASVVTSYYQTILGRAPDAAGLAFWTAEATRVVGLGADVKEVFYAMAMLFFSSPEYVGKNASDSQYITDMYNTFFLRNPDAAGLAYWQGELNAAQSRSALLNSFLFSTEYSTYMASLFGTTFVRPEINMTMDLFRGTFGRLPDSAGFNGWLGVIRQAQCQGATQVSNTMNTVFGAFFNSIEYAARARNDRDFMGDVYNAYMRRGPGGDSGFSFWVGQVPTRGRDGVRAEFVPSTEFQARVSAIIAAGCQP